MNCVMIRKGWEEYGLRLPEWRSEANTGVTLTFFATEGNREVTREVTTEVRAVLKVLTGFRVDV